MSSTEWGCDGKYLGYDCQVWGCDENGGDVIQMHGDTILKHVDVISRNMHVIQIDGDLVSRMEM